MADQLCQTSSLIPSWVAYGFGAATFAMLIATFFVSLNSLKKRRTLKSASKNPETRLADIR